MTAQFTFIQASTSPKNGKTYCTLLNPKNYSKLTMELVGTATVAGLKQGDNVQVQLDLSGDGFRPRLSIESIRKM